MAEERTLSLNPEELSLVLDALGTFRGVSEERGCYVEAARAEILQMRITSGYKRKSKYNTDLLRKACERQARYKPQLPVRRFTAKQIKEHLLKVMEQNRAWAEDELILDPDTAWERNETMKHLIRDFEEI